MSNSLSSKSANHAAALDITLAALAKLDLIPYRSGTKTAEWTGDEIAKFANAVFNATLKNLQDK
ncbi:hypothetical protein [Pseudomonas sp.]|uniref:hypothetical protein n=1 Tax=Pseudomonas sp. TaxID=306 RepID=UPI00398207CC